MSDYRLALEKAQQNVERQKLELERVYKAVERPSQPVGFTPAASSGRVDAAKLQQYLERRRQETAAKGATARSLPKQQPSSSNGVQTAGAASRPGKLHQQQRVATDGKNGHEKARQHHEAKDRDSKKRSPLPPASSSVPESKKAKPSGQQQQPTPSGEASVQRQYLMMRRQELLKELEKIDRKLQKLDDNGQKQQQQQQHSKPGDKLDKKDLAKKKPAAAVQQLPPQARPAPPPPPGRHRAFDEDDDDEEEDDDDADSFIDDSEEPAGGQDYSKIVREVHRSLKFDPRRYASVNPHDDCRSMVASYGDIEREERRSRRLGALEDEADVREEAERRARRAEKRKLKEAKGKA